MALIVQDRVKVNTTTTGTGTIVLGATAPTGYQSFAVIGNNNTTYYTIAGQTTNEWEVGIGTYYLANSSLSRTTILASSNANAAVTFSAGTKDVFVTYPAEKAVYLDSSNVATVPTLAIDTSGTDAQIAPNTGITGWNYSGLSKSIATEETTPNGLFFSPDGLNMYVNGSTGDDVNQYTLSSAWDVSTATYLQLFSTAAQDSAPADIFFKPDGLSMFIMGNNNDTVYQYTLSSAWNISTASYASKSFSVTTQESNPQGLWFKPDGTTMYVTGSAADAVFQYTLGTAWDVSTASYSGISFSISTQEASSTQVNLSADGLTMWITGNIGDDISQYTLGTAWNVSTATFVNNFYIGFQDVNPSGLFIDSTASNRVYMVGTTSDTVFQYNTATNSISAVTDVFNTTSNARVQGNLAVQGNANIDAALIAGNLTVGTTSISGALTATSTLSLGGATASSAAFATNQTTANTTITTSQTTGLLTIGGPAQTGTMTVGQSNATQTTNIQAGATVAAATKTLNIGTNGVSGSTTAINIGSANNTTVTINGNISLVNTLAVGSGGTGLNSLTNNSVMLGNATSAVKFVAPGTTGNVLTSNGTTWTSATPAATGLAAAGNSSIGIFNTNITANATIATGTNGLSVGPVNTANGITVTVAANSTWITL